MAKISKNNIYAIKYLFNQGLSVDQISAELNLTKENIQTIIESEQLVVKPPTVKDLMINKTSVKKTNSVSIMTKEASMMNDHNRTKHVDQSTQTKNPHIFNPFDK